jgi:HAD superfamily hydrolase (TIGR01509 family)
VIQGLIFDFDGLILDTESPIFQSWKELFEEQDCELPFESWASIIGTNDGLFDPYSLLEEQLGRPLNWDELAPKRRDRELDLIAGQPILPGVEDYLAEAKRMGLKLGLASSSSCEWVTGHLSRLSLLAYFDCIRGSDDVERTKPDPGLYLAALKCLDLLPHQVIALEDSPHGIRAAKLAGLFCVAVPNTLTRRLPLDQADLILNSLSDLTVAELLRRVEAEAS